MQTYSTKPMSTFADVTTDVLAEDWTVVSPEAEDSIQGGQQ